MPGRTIAIGDMHGCSVALVTLLDLIRPRPEDTIVTLGDYINRGPDSRGVLDRLIALSSQCRLVPILGNHDLALLEARSGLHPTTWIGMGGIATLDSYGPGRDIDLIPDAHINFLKRCLDYYETDAHIFLHANYDPDLPMSDQPDELLRWESLKHTTPGPHASGKTVVTGHSSQKSGNVLDLGHIICIDTFCYGGGWLTALEVNTREVWQANQRGKRATGDL